MTSRHDHKFSHAWHVAINDEAQRLRGGGEPWPHFMYEAKTAWAEIQRLALLFCAEREGKLPKIHRQCSLSEPEPVHENHLTCCLGTRCSECLFLAAIERAKLTENQKDEAKAWTCVTHIIERGGDTAGEGYLLTVDDRMFWDRTYANMAASDEEATPSGGAGDRNE